MALLLFCLYILLFLPFVKLLKQMSLFNKVHKKIAFFFCSVLFNIPNKSAKRPGKIMHSCKKEENGL